MRRAIPATSIPDHPCRLTVFQPGPILPSHAPGAGPLHRLVSRLTPSSMERVNTGHLQRWVKGPTGPARQEWLGMVYYLPGRAQSKRLRNRFPVRTILCAGSGDYRPIRIGAGRARWWVWGQEQIYSQHESPNRTACQYGRLYYNRDGRTTIPPCGPRARTTRAGLTVASWTAR